MCAQKQNPNTWLFMAVALGILTGLWGHSWLLMGAEIVSEIFMKLLKLISLPILFFALVSTLAGLDNWQELATIGKRILRYSLFTTYIAAVIGLLFLVILKPRVSLMSIDPVTVPEVIHQSYWQFLWQIIPDNIVQAFAHNNVLGIAFFGLLLGTSILKLDGEPKDTCKKIFTGIFAAILNIAGMIIKIMPIGVWAFVALLVSASLSHPERLKELMIYTICVLGANVVQGMVVLPLLLKAKGLSPLRVFKGLSPALIMAFFTKSSSATMPVTLTCLKNNLQVNAKTANTTVPLCTVINMNGCAAFIIVTVLFVAMSHGVTFSVGEMILWTVMATIAALGNAGVPMGCYFLTSAFLVSMNLPLTLLGWILPLYMVIDMVETALNVWSDGCIATIIDAEEKQKHLFK